MKFWASLRSDDFMWMDPASVRLSSQGLTATLARTKASGPGKSVDVLNAHLAVGAYLREPR